MIVKEKDVRYFVEVIKQSLEVQELIRHIAAGGDVPSIPRTSDGESETERLHAQISGLKTQLEQADEQLKNFQKFYRQAKPQLDRYAGLQDELAGKKSELEQKESEIVQLNDSIRTLEAEKAQLSSDLNDAKKEANSLKSRFELPAKYFELYRKLSGTLRAGLENVICDKNEITFIVSCSNENNLSSIWEYAKDISNDPENEEFKILVQIFDYFFDRFNESLPEPKYTRDDVEIGDYLDEDKYDRCCGSATSGDITEIILRGYQSRNTGRTIHKSIVKA
ncbi:hypothetical protein [Ruminococcus sp.]